MCIPCCLCCLCFLGIKSLHQENCKMEIQTSDVRVRFKLFSVPHFLIGAMLVGAAAHIHAAVFDYTHCFGVSGLIAAINGFLVFGAIYLALGLFCCFYPVMMG